MLKEALQNLMVSKTRIFVALVFCLGTGVAGADEKTPPRFSVKTVSETRTGCVPIALAEDSVLHALQGDATLRLSGLVEMRQDTQPLPPMPICNFVLFTNGDRLPVDAEAAAKIEENRLFVWPAAPFGAAHETGLSLYLPQVVCIFWTLPAGVDDAELFFAKLAGEARKRDVAYLRSGDRVEGTLTALSGKTGCIITTDKSAVYTPWAKLAGIAWNTERASRPRPRKSYYHAVLEGGARLGFTDMRFDEKTQHWVGKTQAGPVLDLTAARMLMLDRRLGPVVHLSDLTPLHYEQRPYLGLSWPLAKDAAVTGHPLRVGDSTYDKGLGLHAPCQVAYALDGQYQRFECVVGFDEAIARRGRVRLAVQLDGKRIDVNAGKELTCHDAPLPVQMDVRGVRTLTLIVDLGSFGDVQAHVNWANARLIKQEK